MDELTNCKRSEDGSPTGTDTGCVDSERMKTKKHRTDQDQHVTVNATTATTTTATTTTKLVDSIPLDTGRHTTVNKDNNNILINNEGVNDDVIDESDEKPISSRYLYYSAKQDDELFAVSSIQIDNDMATLRDLRKKILDFNLWSESSKVRFYMNGYDTSKDNKQLAYTTSLNECLIDNNNNNPLYIDVRTSVMNTETITPAEEKEIQSRIERGKSFVTSLSLGMPYENIENSNNMRFLRNVYNLETGNYQDVVIRNITEDFWCTVIEQTKNYRVCTLGTPGIGKTTTTCILIRLLLEQKMTVVYHVRAPEKNGWVYIFEPSEMNDIDVKVSVIREKSFKLQLIEYQVSDILSTYYVVDPGLTMVNCNPPVDFLGKVIIVASPNEDHWGSSSFTKRKGDIRGIFLYYPVWALQELIEAREVFTGNEASISENDIRERFFQFGGVPENIFSKCIELRKKRQMNALSMLSDTEAKTLAFRTRSGVATSSDDLPRGILLSYILDDNDKRNNKYTFENGVAILSSDFIYQFIAKKFMNESWLKIATNDESFDGKLVEAYIS